MAIDKIPDDQLINESFSKNPKPLFQWLGILLVLMIGIVTLQWGLKSALNSSVASRPFTQVTNRDFSVFLWQNPEFMRANSKSKTGYLPAFQYLDSVAMEPEFASEYVVAPPDVLFYYHTWRRQVGDYDFHARINSKRFLEFIEYAEEWKPKYWDAAPSRYVELIKRLNVESSTRLNELPYAVLPLEVRTAYYGWNNYFYNGLKIRNLAVTEEELENFLAKYPLYGRSYWKNIVGDSYLKDVPEEKSLRAFLKQALFLTTQEQ